MNEKNDTTDQNTINVLKKSEKWVCMENCGACCYLSPSERIPLPDFLEDPDDQALYISMVEDDGWCVNFDKKKRACQIFESRPWFCKVTKPNFKKMFEVEEVQFDSFCTMCCREQIGEVYGNTSKEMKRYNSIIRDLKKGTAVIKSVKDPFIRE